MLKNLFFAALVLLTLNTFAQGPIMSAKDFAAELKAAKNLVVVDVMAADVYAKQHVQGAINLPHKELYKPGPVEGQFKSPEELAAIFGKKGISNTARIVLYDDGSQKYSSRVWWILKYLGANEVYLLHKEMNQWAAARIPLTATPVAPKAVTFATTVKPEMNCSMAELQKPAGDLLLLDGREKDEFDGVDKDKRSKGHLPGAVWLNFKEMQTATGAYKSKEEITAVAAKYGATPEKPIVVYCQTGIKASVLYLALKEIAGFQQVRYYAGAYAEWASVPENKMVK